MAHVDSAFEATDLRPELITLLGIAPESPEVEYGWIEPARPIAVPGEFSFQRVQRFWEKPSLALAWTLMARGCLWNSFVMVGRVQTFLRIMRRAVSDLYDDFTQVCFAFNCAREESRIRALYSTLPSTNFSRDVLTKRAAELAVLAVSEVGWSDWGAPQRVLSTLTHMGVHPIWAA